MACEECGINVKNDLVRCAMCGAVYCEKCSKELRACVLCHEDLFDEDDDFISE